MLGAVICVYWFLSLFSFCLATTAVVAILLTPSKQLNFFPNHTRFNTQFPRKPKLIATKIERDNQKVISLVRRLKRNIHRKQNSIWRKEMNEADKEVFAKEFYSRQINMKELGEKGQRHFANQRLQWSASAD